MHEIEPYNRWLNYYDSSKDERSPYFGKEYNYDLYSEHIYGYYIDPAWDYIGSDTLYIKLLYIDYDLGYVVIELIGEWNDAINNDIMHFKRNIIDHLLANGINKFALIGESIFNFHGSDDEYYAEWFEEVTEIIINNKEGWITGVNFPEFVIDEISKYNIDSYLCIGGQLDVVNWRTMPPKHFCEYLNNIIQKRLN